MPDSTAEDLAADDDRAGTTDVIGGRAPKRPAPAKKPAPRPPAGGSTNIMTPEESFAAQQEALAKLEEGKRGVVHTRTREEKRRELKAAKSGRGMWIALGAGTLLAVALIVGLLFFFFADDAGTTPRRSRKTAEAASTASDNDAPAHKEATPAAQERAPAKAESAAPAEDAYVKTSARKPGKMLGTLTLNPGPNVAVTYAGTSLPRQVGAFNLPVTSENGRIEVGDESTQFRIGLEYVVSAGVFTVKVNSSPRGVASVNGRTVSIAKLEKAAQTVVEVKKPGEDSGMTVRLAFRPN
jgi:hypothetical protein